MFLNNDAFIALTKRGFKTTIISCLLLLDILKPIEAPIEIQQKATFNRELQFVGLLEPHSNRGVPQGIVNPADLKADLSGESLFLVDSKQNCIFTLDQDFIVKKVIGRYGQGPLDFDYPKLIHSSPANEMVIYDTRNIRLQWITTSGEYIKSLRIPFLIINDFQILDNGNILISPTSNIHIRYPDVVILDQYNHTIIDSFSTALTGPNPGSRKTDNLYGNAHIRLFKDGRIALIYIHIPKLILLDNHLKQIASYSLSFPEFEKLEEIVSKRQMELNTNTILPLYYMDAAVINDSQLLISVPSYDDHSTYIFYAIDLKYDPIQVIRYTANVPKSIMEDHIWYRENLPERRQDDLIPHISKFIITSNGRLFGVDDVSSKYLCWHINN